MEPEWSFPNPDPPKPRSIGSKIAIGVAGSIGVWLLVDELLSIFNVWFIITCLAGIGWVLFLRNKSGQRSQQLWVFLILAACGVGWLLLVFLFSFLNVWLFLLLTAVLGVVVFAKERQKNRRQQWLDTGCCGNCGYDLRGTPDRCPECGRESILDEPTWRKLRREWGNVKPVEPAKPEMAEPVPEPVMKVPTILKTPDFHDGPIPLEGEGGEKTNDQGPKSQSNPKSQ
jgi:Ca2+/Na+ antiporter